MHVLKTDATIQHTLKTWLKKQNILNTGAGHELMTGTIYKLKTGVRYV